jgi:hypothetical protein
MMRTELRCPRVLMLRGKRMMEIEDDEALNGRLPDDCAVAGGGFGV